MDYNKKFQKGFKAYPGEQGLFGDVRAILVQAVPGSQSKQESSLIARVVGWYFPAGQYSGLEVPSGQ